MAVPKRRTSKSKSRMGRAHHAMKPVAVVYCPQCHTATLPHRVCSSCGHYQGKEIVRMEEA